MLEWRTGAETEKIKAQVKYGLIKIQITLQYKAKTPRFIRNQHDRGERYETFLETDAVFFVITK